MSYTLVGYGAVTSPSTEATSSTLAKRIVIAPRTTTTTGTPGMMDPGQITPERCRSAGWHWDEVAQRCLEQPPEQVGPGAPPDTGSPSSQAPVFRPRPSGNDHYPVLKQDSGGYNPVQDCHDRGGCWDQVRGCISCSGEENVPVDQDVAKTNEDDSDWAMYAGFALVGAAALAGGWFLVSRKKKKKG